MSEPTNPATATGTPQGESIPGPANPHPDGMNDPGNAEQYGGPGRQDHDKK